MCGSVGWGLDGIGMEWQFLGPFMLFLVVSLAWAADVDDDVLNCVSLIFISAVSFRPANFLMSANIQ